MFGGWGKIIRTVLFHKQEFFKNKTKTLLNNIVTFVHILQVQI